MHINDNDTINNRIGLIDVVELSGVINLYLNFSPQISPYSKKKDMAKKIEKCIRHPVTLQSL